MKLSININVTAHDIKIGRPRVSGWCPIARAFKRGLRRKGIAAEMVSAGTVWLRAYDKNGRALVGRYTSGRYTSYWMLGCSTPEVLTKFMELFDRGYFVEPFSHTLELEVIG